jgi:hypothetical protein
MAHCLLGKPGNNPFCHHRALELLKKGRRERIRRVQHGTGLPFDTAKYEIVEEEWPAEALAQAERVVAEQAQQLLDEEASIYAV